MSILIKGMEMPENCTECNFGVDGWCYAKEPTEPNSKSLATHTRPTWCPLVELSPHGKWSDEMVACRDEYGDFHFGYQCSACGAILNRTNYCGACGAKMDL